MYKRTNIELDTSLLKRAMELTQIKTIKDVVNYSLNEVIRMSKRKELLNYKGKLDWDGDLDEMRSI
ncbi:MAG: type II toxin-antitoxin system VapB family antitoxin [Bacteroidales bacterium]|nr:type II toxin-antitoxin system VapB family antitoxin [Bacteroidales bacterium]